MPPEPLPWDRKDFYKERKHERTQSLPQQPLTARWRDSSSMSPYQHGSFREFTRWGSADFRRPPGHGRQGSWHLFAEGNGGHGFVPSRSGNKILDDEIFRQSDSRVDGKYGRNSRENNRGSYSQRDWRGHSWESCNGSPSTPGRPHHVNIERRSVDDMSSYQSHAHSDFVNTWDQLQKGQNDNKTSVVNELGTGQKCQRENSAGSIDWKPLKWSRSGSLSSRGSGFSHSSSSKSLGVDSGEGKVELQLKNLTPVQSPSGDAAVCVATAAPSDETTSRKKPRLAWGEGLAKYEKKKVEGPDTSTDRGGATISVCNTEFNNSMSSNLADKSPRVLGFSDCASPATPSSVACSSSPGVEEKSFGKAANIDNDISNLCGSPSIGSKNHMAGPSFNLEKLDINSIINMGSSLINLLQPDDPCTVDSSFVLSTAINKLLLLKGDALKALEMTESEIDSLENELKSLKGDSRSGCSCPATSSSLPVEEHGKACGEQEVAFSIIPRPAHLKIDTCADVPVKNLPICNGVPEEVNGDIDSPGTATSEFVEPLSSEKAVSPSDIVKFHECSGDLGSVQLTTMDEVILAAGSGNEGTATTISVEGSVLKKIDNDAPVSESSSSDAGGENVMYDIILAANKELAIVASEVFNKLLPKDFYGVEISEIANVACTQSDTAIREKIAMRKQYLRFKERVLTLKFKAFQNAWKEDMRSLSMRKYRAKSQKKYELALRSTHGGYQKHRSSIRSRVPSPAGNLVREPSAEMINFASKLIPDSYGRIHRNALKMPALILDEKEKKVSRFISTNGLVEDPFAIEKERALINPWTSVEKEIFIDKLAAFGKDFRKIASFLDHKTTADCVEFYYKNHKSECFEKTKNKNDLSKQGKSAVNTYLLTSGKKRSRENAASLDVLGAASVIAAHAESSIQNRHKSSGRIFLGGRFDSKTSRIDDSIAIRSSNLDIVGSDQDTVAADVLAGICGSFSSEAMGSCITSSAGPGENYHHDWKCHKVDSVVKRYSTSDVLQNLDEDTCSDESCGEMDSAHWTDEEKSIFIQAVSSYGKDFEMISRYVGTRSRDQCKVFFSKARKCLGLDLIHPRTRNMGTPMSDDANGGGNDTEDACVQESSLISGDKLGSNVEGDLPPTIVSMNVDELDPTREASLQTDLIRSEGNDGSLVECKNSEAVEAIFSDVDKTGPISEGGADDNMDIDSNQAESIQVQKSAALANLNALRNHIEQGVSLAVSASHGGTFDPHLSSLNALVEPKSDAAWSSEGFGNNSEARRTLLSKNGMDEHVAKCSSETGSQLLCRSDSNKSGDESIDKNFVTKGLHQVPLDLGFAGKPSISLLPDESSFAKISALHDSDTSQCDTICNQDRLSSTLAYPETEEKQASKAVSGHESDQFSGNPLVDLAEMQISTSKEINVDVGRSQLPDVKRFSTSERCVTGSFSAQDYLHKCNGPKPAAELPQLVQKLEQANSRQKSHFRSLSDTEKPGRNGNVKLFGQILNSSSQDDEKVAHFSKQSAKYSDLNLTGRRNVDGNVKRIQTEFDQNIIFAPENVPKRSYGFWDGNRIQTGLSSLPDSAILVAKYPAAFVNYPSSSSQMEQQASQTVVRNTDINLNGVSAFTPREISSNGAVMDCQAYRNHDRTKVAPLTAADVKQQQGMISEMQRRNIQQQGRGKVGMNVVGSNLSDPVAVLRMQFAKTEAYGGQNGSRTREEESWRGKG
ncbi:POWERDRESS [Hibiscus trionum]|uniref:POWERDRESS n=1 Tax=Hibiscus trionum TaxID=183268 RepID=A0A9W7I3R5_HIBTR|nr:POWERDRESS [Hibiscus trionum]